MIVVFGEGRGFRVVWLLEEMGLAYRLRSVELLAGVEKDPEFLAITERPRRDGHISEPVEVGDATAQALALSCRSEVHGSGHFGDLRLNVGSKEWGSRPRRCRTGLYGPHQWT